MEKVIELASKRLELIERLELGEIDKELFIIENNRLIGEYSPRNFNVRSIEEGIVKYHYFNTKAKMLMLEADEVQYRDARRADSLRDNAYEYYVKKDKITLAMLELVKFKGVEAYFIKMNSRYLDGIIYEINFLEYKKVILHSKDKRILYKLKEAECFNSETKNSIICEYVNTKI